MPGGKRGNSIGAKDCPFLPQAFQAKFPGNSFQPIFVGTAKSGPDHDGIASLGIRPDQAWKLFPEPIVALVVHVCKIRDGSPSDKAASDNGNYPSWHCKISLARAFSTMPGVAHLETLTSKPDVIAQMTRKFLLEPGGVLARNTMLAGAPARRGTLAWQHLRADAQSDEIGTQASLFGLSPRDPFLDAGDANTSQGKGYA